MTDESIFAAALAIGRPTERAAFLDRACADDPSLRRQVEELLAAHLADNPLDRPPVDLGLTGAYEPPDERPGAAVGPYKLLQQIGEGGMGTVFMAEQQEPVRRKVALKIVKPGMDSRQVVARFEAERQALAMMDHQNIARVLDAGATATGRPFFVMELVHGVPITDFCDANKLTPRQRLELFVPVCQAIQHAHQKGIIHRDIKPGNILVTMYDDRPVPKVIDFGVAKAVEQRLTERTLFTQFGALVGTFEYMSPEQADMNAFGVDTRSDVYSLGVLLYELLTGTTPLERQQLRQAALDEVVRLIKEEEPPRPSLRLSSSGMLAKVAAARQTEPATLSALVRGELDWIVMRCLEKDRSRRYDTASALARDVERYLHDEPVEACPPTVGYRLRKFYRKNRTVLVTALLYVVTLKAGILFSLWQASRAYRAERETYSAEREAAWQRDVAIDSRYRAEDAQQAAAAERDRVAQANQSLNRLAAQQRRTLYATSMNLAQAAWETGNPGRTFELLRQQTPKPGEDDLRGFEWHYWERFAHLDLKSVRLAGHGDGNGIERFGRLSQDGTRAVAFVAGSSAGTTVLKLWDAETGKEVWSIPVAADTGSYPFLEFSRDGRRLVTTRLFRAEGAEARRAELRVWDAATGTVVYADDASDGQYLSSPVLSPDGSRLALILYGRRLATNPWLCVRRLPDGKEIFRWPPKPSRLILRSPAFSPDGKRLAAAIEDGATGNSLPTRTMKIWDLENAKEIQQIALPVAPIPHRRGSIFSPDGARIATSAFDDPNDSIILWDAAGGKKLQALNLPSSSGQYLSDYPIAFDPNGKRLAVREGAQVYLFDIDPGRAGAADSLLRTLRGHESWVQDVVFGVNGSRLVTLDAQGIVKQWDPAPREQRLHTPFGVRSGDQCTLPNPDGSRIAFVPARADPEHRFRITDRFGRLVGETVLPPGHSHAQSFSLDGRTFALLWHQEPFGFGSVFALFVWDAVTGKEIRRLHGPDGRTIGPSFALSPDGSRIVTCTFSSLNDSALVVWETSSGRVLLSRRSPQFQCYPSYSPDGRWIVFCDSFASDAEDRIVWLDARTGEEAAVLKVRKGRLGRADEILFSHDGRRMTAIPRDTSGPASLYVWEAEPILRGESSEPMVTLTGHGDGVRNTAFSPDGRRILTSGGGAIKLWDAVSGREVLTLKAKGVTVGDAFFSPDGNTIWGGLDEDGRLWGWDGSPVREGKTP